MRSRSYFWVGLAMASAAMFGASTPFAKLLLGVGLDPRLLAGLLYDWHGEPRPEGTFRPLRVAKEKFAAAA